MSSTSPPQSGTALRRTLTTPKIVFLVVAAAAPAASMVGTVPLAYALGNGIAVPAMFVFAGLTLLCFSVGYAAMSRHVVSTGGFYTYMARGLGRPPAVGGALVALVAYNSMTIGLVGAFAYFSKLLADSHGLYLAWPVWAALAIVLLGVLGYREVEISAWVLAVLMLSEVAILAILDIGVLAHRGGAALPVQSFSAHAVTGPGLGVGMMFAFMSFIGFESAALYGEEAAAPTRSIPLATYISVILIAVFYTLTSWTAVGGIGPAHLVSTAQQQLGSLFFGLSDTYVGQWASQALEVLVCTSLFASVLALHNSAGRYTFALGRERVLPSALGRVHPRHGSPSRASLVQTGLTTVVVAAFAAAGLDPYTSLATSMTGLGTLGIVVLQGAAALSVIGFFWRRADRHWWRSVLAPLLGLAGLITAAALVVRNFSLVTGTGNWFVNLLPWLLLVVALAGTGYALWMRRALPGEYAPLAGVDGRVDERAADKDPGVCVPYER